jgi:two-component sensor histidine kinase
MALIHEKLYRSKNLAQVDFAEYIQDLATYLLRSQNAHRRGITLKTETEDVLLKIDTAIPCGLILNELVSNALKHAFPNGRRGEIRVELRASRDHQVVLKVGDNGVGFPQGMDFHQTESLGLQLVNTLVGQLVGNLELDHSCGTEFRVTFPVA